MNGRPLTIAQVSQKSATEHIAVESRIPRLVRGSLPKSIPRIENVTGTAVMGSIIFHSEKRIATMMGTAAIGAIKVKISPRSAIIVEICSSRCITNGLILVLY
jgi:hypothetical protein